MANYEQAETDPMQKLVRSFVKILRTIDPDCPNADFYAGTYEIDADLFNLTFVLTDEMFEIRNIDTRNNSGIGRKVITVIHTFADAHELTVLASNVVPEARGFWKKMGYQESNDGDETFYRTE